MATKREKRERAAAQRAKFMAEVEASGLAAQKADREHREWQEEEVQRRIIAPINARHRAILSREGVMKSSPPEEGA